MACEIYDRFIVYYIYVSILYEPHTLIVPDTYPIVFPITGSTRGLGLRGFHYNAHIAKLPYTYLFFMEIPELFLFGF